MICILAPKVLLTHKDVPVSEFTPRSDVRASERIFGPLTRVGATTQSIVARLKKNVGDTDSYRVIGSEGVIDVAQGYRFETSPEFTLTRGDHSEHYVPEEPRRKRKRDGETYGPRTDETKT